MPPIIEASRLVKRFGDIPAVDHLDLVAPAGRITALLGPNGAGKTTFVRLVATLLRPDGGELRVAGINAWNDPARVRPIIGLAGQFAKDYVTRNGAKVLLTSLDREAEFRADQASEVYLARSGFDPLSLYAVLQKMTAFGTKSAALAELYKTHPPLADRLDRIDTVANPGVQAFAGR